MGSFIELNDTLKLRRGAGFPERIELGGLYDFTIDGRRLYNLKPARVFLVEEIDTKWNYVGHAMIHTQSIDADNDRTMGRFEVILVYPPEYVLLLNRYEPPPGKGYTPSGVTQPPVSPPR